MSAKLKSIIEEKSLITGNDIKLSKGGYSYFYFDCKKTTLNGEALNLVADAFIEKIDLLPQRPDAIGGLTMGADFIVAAVVMRSHQIGHATINGSIVRTEPKKHGTQSKIENHLEPGTPIVVVDDVITTGGSIAAACDRFLESGYRIAGIIALVDRQAGGSEVLSKKYFCPVHSIFTKNDFIGHNPSIIK